MRPPKYGFEITFDVDGDEMLICCVGFNADEAIATAREIAAEGGYDQEYPVIQVKRY